MYTMFVMNLVVDIMLDSVTVEVRLYDLWSQLIVEAWFVDNLWYLVANLTGFVKLLP